MDTWKDKTLLLVEDEAILAMDKIQRLKKFGYSVIHVTSGGNAIEAVNRDNPPINLILMDIDLGKGMDGTEAAEKILATRDIPILFLSSHTEKEVVEKTEKITSYGYVVKNSGITVLDASIKMAFKLFDAQREINHKNMAIKAGNENLRVTIEKLEETNKSLIHSQSQLQINEMRYKKGQEIGHIGSWEYDIKTNLIWGSDEAKRIYNLPVDTDTLTLEEVEVMDKDKDRMKQALLDLIQKEAVYNMEFQITPKGTDNIKWIHSIAELKKDEQGNPVKIVGVIQDITDSKNTEMKLRESEESLTITLQSIGDAVLATDLSGNITRMNRAAEKLTGWKAAEAMGKPLVQVFKIINADSRRQVKNPVEKVLNSGTVVELANHTVLVSRDGREYQIADSAAPIRDFEGTVHGVILVFYDVTEKYNREKESKRIQLLFEAMFNTIPDGVVITDTQRTIQFANEGIRSTFGYEPAEIIGQKTALLYSEDLNYTDTGSHVFGKNAINPEKRYLTYYKNKKGRTFPGETIGSKLYDNAGTWIGNLGIMRDITEQETMIADLSEAKERAEQSKAEKELLIREVHHRIKNHMNTIRSLLSLQADSSHNKDTIDALRKAEDRVYTMMVLYDKLYRSENFQSIPVRDYLSTLINDIMDSLSVPRLHVIRKIQIDDFVLNAERLSVVGIIVNELISNSMKYSFKNRETGTITLEIFCKNNMVHVCVSDDGVGIPDSAIQSTLPGFGMQLVSTLTAQINGTITFGREKGTKVTLEFEYEPE